MAIACAVSPNHILDSSSELSIIKERKVEWRTVDSVAYYVHKKIGKPESLRIEYLCGLRRFPIWIMPYHGGVASRNSNHIFSRLKKEDIVFDSIKDIVIQKDKIKMPTEILVDVSEKYPFIEDFKF